MEKYSGWGLTNKKLKIGLLYDLVLLSMGIYPKELPVKEPQGDICTAMCSIIKIWMQPTDR